MATQFSKSRKMRFATAGFKVKRRTGLKVKLGRADVRPTEAELAADALAAAEEPEGIDLGPLSHAERNKILFNL